LNFDFARYTGNIHDPELLSAINEWCTVNRSTPAHLVQEWASWIYENANIKLDIGLCRAMALGCILQGEINQFSVVSGVGFHG